MIGMSEADKACNCGTTMKQVWRAAETPSGRPEFKGWYCPGCEYFDPAIGRERRWLWHAGAFHRVNGK